MAEASPPPAAEGGNTGMDGQGPVDGSCREIGDQAVWSLSSCKPGFGVEQIRDDNIETYWQSDGPQPHFINIQFLRRRSILHLGLYMDYTQDESYTPQKLSIRMGTHFHDLKELTLVDLEDPKGWYWLDLTEGEHKGVRGHVVQIAILANHQNGRDTHIRQVKIYGPLLDQIPLVPDFVTAECAMSTMLR
eukprot:comp13868_c0_seq1/m.9628 comp13868_c0_seq1/g.9628  ORF comp13868_c0_seq1/g.9628 comp13868_c0_seq1/m.9628 type:complete len:190 (-) comp13868_c0_seq1:103-672(-)